MSKRFDIHDWQAKQRQLSEDKKEAESMSNSDIRALQTVVGEYSLNKVLNTIAVIADRIGKHDEADMVKNFADKIQDFEPMDMDEANMTGTGASFNAGAGEGYATPNAFAKKSNWKRKNEKYEE